MLQTDVLFHTNSHDHAEFNPIPALARPDADTMLVFLAGKGVEFYKATNDPWYRGTMPGDNALIAGTNETITFYRPEEAASPLGCSKQFQFCNPSFPGDNKCGPLASWLDAMIESATLFNLTAEDMLGDDTPFPNHRIGSRFNWLIMQIAYATMDTYTILSSLEARSLVSQRYLAAGVMGELPENQWQLDVSHWFAIQLASIQAGVVNTALGPSDPALGPYKIMPPNEHVRDLCNSQVRSSGIFALSVM